MAVIAKEQELPEGWAFANGDEMQIPGNEVLYSLMCQTFGNFGSTFNLPIIKLTTGNRVIIAIRGTNPMIFKS